MQIDFQWENHAKSLKLEEQTLRKIKDRIQEKVMNQSGTWIDWQYLLDAATLLKKVSVLFRGHGVVFCPKITRNSSCNSSKHSNTFIHIIFQCRYTLQYTYPYAYYLEKGPRKQLVCDTFYSSWNKRIFAKRLFEQHYMNFYEFNQQKITWRSKMLYHYCIIVVRIPTSATRGRSRKSILESWKGRNNR